MASILHAAPDRDRVVYAVAVSAGVPVDRFDQVLAPRSGSGEVISCQPLGAAPMVPGTTHCCLAEHREASRSHARDVSLGLLREMPCGQLQDRLRVTQNDRRPSALVQKHRARSSRALLEPAAFDAADIVTRVPAREQELHGAA